VVVLSGHKKRRELNAVNVSSLCCVNSQAGITMVQTLPQAKRPFKQHYCSSSSTPTKRHHPSVLKDYLQYRREVEAAGKKRATEARQEAQTLSESDPEKEWLVLSARSVERRLWSYAMCGLTTQVRVCGSCGDGRAGSGLARQKEGLSPCQARCCEFCAKRRGAKVSAKFKERLCAVPIVDGYFLSQLTFTFRYNPEDPGEYTTKELRRRVKKILEVARHGWGRRLKATGAGLLVKIELSADGNVHAHGLYYGPWQDKEALEDELCRSWADAGFTHIKSVANQRELELYLSASSAVGAEQNPIIERVSKSIRETLKYTTKGPSPLDEGYLEGDARRRVDPDLAAKWEMALYGVRLLATYGCFRGGADDEVVSDAELQVERGEQECDDDVQCGCGKIGTVRDDVTGEVYEWEWHVLPTYQWVRLCHREGLPAYPHSRWSPPEACGT